VTIFSLGIFRDYLYVLFQTLILSPSFSSPKLSRDLLMTTLNSYSNALSDQPTSPTLLQTPIHLSAIPLFLTGNVLVLTSMYALGITGTYLGDYFGILMDAPVTSFPFNVSAAPMYHGSTLSFLATAIWKGKPAGLVLTGLVALAYSVARRWEDPFTGMIYEKRDKQRREGKKAL
jgi:phosphatidylethanolamine N-methyltransferase